MKKTIIVLIFFIYLLSAGCASTPRERLIDKCSQYENTGTIPAEVNNVDRLLNSFAGLFEGGLVGFIGGSIIISVHSEWFPAANAVLITSMIIGPVIGWNIAGPGNILKKGEFSEDEMKKTCADLKASEERREQALTYKDKLPVEYDFRNFLCSLAGFSAGSSLGYTIGALFGCAVNNPGTSGNALISPGGLIGGGIGGLIGGIGGAIYGWNAPERFISDDEVVERVLKGSYMKKDEQEQKQDEKKRQKLIESIPTPDIPVRH
jgi:hypothetical protein